MKRKALLLGVSLALLLVVPGMAFAANAYLHYFDCKNCHFPNATMDQMSNDHVCLKCHSPAGDPLSPNDKLVAAPAGTILDYTADGKFSVGDASARFGHNATPVQQTSHNWTAPSAQPGAGAQEPTTLTSRYGASLNKVTCSRCHNPHGEAPIGSPSTNLRANPKLLVLDPATNYTPMDPEKLCRTCHLSYASQDAGNNGHLGHPVTTANYETIIALPENAGKYKSLAEVNAAGGASKPVLVGGKVTCLTCHGVHFTDSSSTSLDGMGQTLNNGDGYLLKGDGLNYVSDPARSTTFCNTCHNYTSAFHSAATAPSTGIGCMGCHGGHNYNDGQPTWYMLDDPTGAYVGGTAPPTDKRVAWAGTAGVVDGFCERCHGDILTWVAGGDNLRTHTAADITGTPACDKCHEDHSTMARPIGCDGCHGYPPRTATGGEGSNGYAIDIANKYSYKGAVEGLGYTNGGITYLDESTTAHAEHAFGIDGANRNHKFDCDQCHKGNSHDGATVSFQDVFIDKTGILAGTQSFVPTYTDPDTDGIFTCGTNVYCHSDGVSVRAGGATAKPVPAWSGGATTCASCHNTGTTGTAAVHATHLSLSSLSVPVTCDTCHTKTSADGSSLKDAALNTGGAHVNGQVDVNEAFNTYAPAAFASGTGTCAVYCHSNGYGTNIDDPNWDDLSGGACGDCHDLTGNDPTHPLSGAHKKHIVDLGYACTTCHTHSGAFSGDHINGSVDAPRTPAEINTVCNPCHGATETGSDDDLPPVWSNASSVNTCIPCHTGTLAVIGTQTAPDKTLALTSGHNRQGGAGNAYPSGNNAASKQCTDCHSAADTGHFDGDQLDKRLVGGFACTTCHPTKVAHRGKQCYDCHNPHGTTNWLMIYATQTEQNTRDTSGSNEFGGDVVFTAYANDNSYDEVDSGAGANLDDICATCHASLSHNNRADTGTHFDGETKEGTNCFTCHNAHENASPFSPNASTCEGCHATLATKGAHAAHMNILPDIDTDKSECAICHTGADTYTVDVGGLHRNGTKDTAAALSYNATNGTCANVCHKTVAAVDGDWRTDTALDCNACHYYDANPTLLGNDADADKLTGDHSAHFGAGSIVTCADCHVVPVAGDTAHITDVSGANEGAVLTGKATALQNEATLTAAALGSNIETDAGLGNDTCNNVACHNPSNTTYSAQWNVSASACTLCHSATDPGTGSHDEHLAASATFGINTIACTSCHGATPASNAHRNGSVTFAGTISYNTSTDKCTTTVCHNDGRGVAVETPAWNTASPDCTICHGNAPATYEHGQHVGNFYVAGCADCHTSATATTHINGTRNLNGAKLSSLTLAGDGTCATSCHNVIDGRDWTSGTSLLCTDCHSSTYIGSGANGPSSGLHIGPLTVSNNTHDDSFQATRGEAVPSAGCVTCHTTAPSTAHINGTMNNSAPTITIAAEVQFVDDATTPTCGPNGSLISCHDDDGAWKRRWSTTAKNSNGTECANCHGTYDLGFTSGVVARHQTATTGDADGQIASSHDGTDKCYTCHAYKAGDTTYYNFATKHRDNAIQINSNVTLQAATATGVGCTSCHSGSDGTADEQHMFQDVIIGNGVGFERWNLESISGPAADCTSCHTLNGRTHTDATENATLHDLHVANQYVTGCTNCHSNAGPGNLEHNNGTVNFGGTYMSSSINYGPAPGDVDFGGTCAGAGVNGCHNAPNAGAVNGDWADWTAVTSSILCTDCHNATGKLLDQGAYPPSSNHHGEHLLDPYVDSCNACHGATASTGKHAGHKDTNVDIAAEITTYTTFAAAGDGSCTNTCHLVTAASEYWNAVKTAGMDLACANCHGVAAAGKSLYVATGSGAYPPTSGEHTPHLNNNALVPGDCNDCHGANATTGTHANHLNQLKDVDNKVTDLDLGLGGNQVVPPGGWNGTCANTCHLANTANDWLGTGSLTCADCHNADGNVADLGTFSLDQGNWPPSSAKHSEHLNNNTYVPNDCNDCHGANANTGGHSGHMNGINTTDVALTYNNGTQTCTNSCHVANTSGDWTGAGALACLDCHAGTYIGGDVAGPGNNLPLSGLHTGTLTVTGNTHDDSFQATSGEAVPSANCVTCHTATPSSAHITGTLAAAEANFAADVTKVGSTCAPVGGLINCHDDGGAWKRKWDASARDDATPLNECANCHGDFATGFVTGMSLRHQVSGPDDVDGQVASSHDTCNTCHTYKAGDETFYQFATDHRDGNIQLNSGMGFTDAGAVVGCTGCHVANDGTADEGHQFQDTYNGDVPDDAGLDRWGRVLQAGPAADCAGCHNSLLTNAHTSANESVSTHDLHTASLYYAGQNCTLCHLNNGPGGSLHNNGTVNFANNLPSSLDYTWTGFSNNCATANGCHSADNGEWVAGNLGGDACTDCHAKTGTFFTLITSTAYPPNTGAHAAHNANTAYVGLNDCSECHGAGAATGAQATHKDKALDNTVTYVAGTKTCTNTCHIANTTDDWTATGTLSCADCHDGSGSLDQGTWPPTSNKHTQHVSTAPNAAYGDITQHSTTTAYEFGCGQCHGNTASNHVNGTKEIAVTNWGGAVTKTCGQNSCHQDGTGGAPVQATVDWDATPGYTGSDVCAICHLNSPNTAAHDVHVQGIHSRDIYTGGTGLMAPGTGPATSHGNEGYSTTINCNTCHYGTVTANFNDRNTYCDNCHGNAAPAAGDVTAPAKGNMTVNVKSAHIDSGAVKVQFRAVQVKSKAQLRNVLADAGLDTVWTRTGGYKTSGAYDLAAAALVPNDYADATCTNACHNGKNATWTTPANNCMSCHTRLPQ